MEESPSLFSLCLQTIARAAIEGHEILQNVSELPLHLIECLLTNVPPLALQSIHEKLAFNDVHPHKCEPWDKFCGCKKRGREMDISRSWEKLFKSRWPDYFEKRQLDKSFSRINEAELYKSVDCDMDWQQLYWEVHLQSCLDEVSEIALLPGFSGRLSDVNISDSINKHLGCLGSTCLGSHDYTRLSYHCKKFGHYLRNVRLQNVLCAPETSELLCSSELQNVVFCNLRSKRHVDGVCCFLDQNKKTLTSIKLLHCKLPPHALSEICDCISTEKTDHRIKHLSFVSSSLFEKGTVSSTRFLKFLLSGRSLLSLRLSDVQMEPKLGRLIFNTLCHSSSSLSVLDISDNNLMGWLSKSYEGTGGIPLSQLLPDVGLQSLQVVSLRGNNLSKDDAGNLKNVLLKMPKLSELDLSDNPLHDDGIKLLLPYFVQASEKSRCLACIKLENCSLSAVGVIELLMTLSSIKQPHSSLSIADNDLGSCIGGALAKFLRTSCINSLNVASVNLGSSGFQDFGNGLPEILRLVYLNMSKNRGGIAAAAFLSKILLKAPELLSVNAAHNFMPSESLNIICDALKGTKGKLRTLDLTGNEQLRQAAKNKPDLEKFTYLHKAVVILPSSGASLTVPYDDDP